MSLFDLSTNPRTFLHPIFAIVRMALWGLLVAPWVLWDILRLSTGWVSWLRWNLRRLRLSTAMHMPCQLGHASSVTGAFECRTCGALYAGFVFAPCPNCGACCGYTTCEHCGMTVQNPWI